MTAAHVSVVTVVRNDIEGLRSTLGSIDAQTDASIERVIIDGDSDDGTADFVRSFVGTEATTAISEPDAGIYDAMNKGLALASGRYVVFLNAGDRWARPDVAENALATLVDAEWGFGRAQVVLADGATHRRVTPRGPMSKARFALSRNPVNHQAVWFRTDVLHDLGGFDTRLRLAADFEVLTRAWERAAPVTWDTIDVVYAAGGASDVRYRQALHEMEIARRSLLGGGAVADVLSPLVTAAHVADVRVRHALRRLAARTSR